MLRSLYRGVLHLHPSGFRQRFADEMLSIFDHSAGKSAAVRLLLDGIASLARQWTLRPEFWREPPMAQPAAPDGIPSFGTLDPFRPRTGAVIQGLLLSTVLFFLICSAIRYSGIHVLHVHIPEATMESQLPIRPNPRSTASAGTEIPTIPSRSESRASVVPHAKPSFTSNVPPRVLPAKRAAQSRASKSPATSNVLSQPAGIPPAVHNGSAKASAASNSGQTTRPQARVVTTTTVNQAALKSYVGTYVAEPPSNLTISITAENGQLTMKIDEQLRRPMAEVTETKFVAIGRENCWIEFSAGESNAQDSDGIRSELQLFRNGQQITARRR